MRKSVNPVTLSELVNDLCDKATKSFSAYDITLLVRKNNPGLNVFHNDVRGCVENYVRAYGLQVIDNNGMYKLYVPKATIVQSNKSRLQTLLEQKTGKVAVQTVVQPTVATSTKEVLHLQLEGKINLTNFVREKFPQAKSVTITRDFENKLEIIPGGPIDTSKEIRVRTGFKCLCVTAEITKNKITITPI